MKALVASGGAAKGAYTAGVVYHMLKRENLEFDIAIGTSTGSLVGGPALLGEARYLRNVYVGVDDPDVLNNTLIGKIISLLTGSPVPFQADMNPLYDMLKEYYITQGKLQELRNRNKILIPTVLNVRTGKIEHVSSADVGNTISEETFIRAIVASCSEPIFTKPIQIFGTQNGHPMENDLFFDGGVKEFMPVQHAVDLGAEQVYAVSTHPLSFNETDWGGNGDPDNTNVLNVLKWLIDSTLNEVERGDLFRAFLYSRLGQARDSIAQVVNNANIDAAVAAQLKTVIDEIIPQVPDILDELYVIAPPEDRPMSASLDFDPAVMLTYFANGRLIAEDFFAPPGPRKFTEAGDYVMALGN